MKGAILMKKTIKVILAVVLAVVLLGAGAFGVLYAGRIKTLSSIQKITDSSTTSSSGESAMTRA